MMAETTKIPVQPEPELVGPDGFDEVLLERLEARAWRERMIGRLRLLWENRRLLARVAGCGLLISALMVLLIPKRYESTARLMPPDSQSGAGLAMLAGLSGQMGGALGALAGDVFGMKSTSALFVGILRSRTVSDRLIERFALRKAYRLLPIGRLNIESARTQLASRTVISEDRKSGIITITVTDADPRRAQAIAQAYVEELNRLVAEVATSAARRERIFLEQRLASVKQELDQAAQEFSRFASKNTAIDIKEQGKAMFAAVASLQGQLIAAQTELEGLRQIFTDNNVRVRSVRARIAELQRQLEKLGGREAGASGDVSAHGESLYPSIRTLPLLGVTYADLYRRTKIAEVVFELLTQQYELSKVQEAKEIPTVKVLDEPVVPEVKSFPPRIFITASGTAFAFLLGAVWVLGSKRWSEVDAQDPGKQFAVEVAAAIRAGMHKVARNGFSPRGLPRKLWRQLRGRSEQPESGTEA
jgi:capsule polysaccharide export protein KpsE/RkpR